MPGISDENERSGASGNHAVNVGQELVSRLKALNDRLEADVARLRITDAEREAIATAARIAGAVGESDIKATLKALLERLGAEVARLRLTDAECDDLRMWSAECVRQANAAIDGGNEELAERWNERAKRAAAMIERQILNVRKLVDS